MVNFDTHSYYSILTGLTYTAREPKKDEAILLTVLLHAFFFNVLCQATNCSVRAMCLLDSYDLEVNKTITGRK